MMDLPKWVSRTAALSLLVFVIGALYLLLVSPVIEAYRSTDEASQEALEQLARYEHISKTNPNRKAELEKLSKQQSRSGVYLAGDTDALAAAGLQEDVSAKIKKNGGNVRSMQILPVKADGDFKRVSVRVQLTATLGSFARILYALESGKPYVFIDNLDVKNRRARKSKKETDEDPELVIRFDLFGYLRPELG
ncbi:MAG: type II secretion system protein GspM [Rhodospirillales bacterium]|nr:type II secretion system protein GspM [Rhodospirillales bacterium]MDH3918104.1 type II secretion system protein GspM [Rhodospirillales bacterium]